jgi:hypothetical protein
VQGRPAVNIKLIRDYIGADCTQGVLSIGDHAFQTMERPWIAQLHAPCGRKGVSSIPPGVYELYRHNSEAHPHTFALVNPTLWVYHFEEDVPVGQTGLARTVVLIHPASFASELRGCIAPGMSRNTDGGRRMVSYSRKAMEQIQSLLPWISGEHTLEIQ